jgi:hypothetical protein
MVSCLHGELYNSVVVQPYPMTIYNCHFHRLFVDVNRFKVTKFVAETHGRIIAACKIFVDAGKLR